MSLNIIIRNIECEGSSALFDGAKLWKFRNGHAVRQKRRTA
jgi:hypothetical protein